MSNRRRKRTGSQKIARNLAIRIRRGAVKAGNPLPGHGTWRDTWLNATTTELDGKPIHTDTAGRILTDHATITTRTTQLRNDLKDHTELYWRGA